MMQYDWLAMPCHAMRCDWLAGWQSAVWSHPHELYTNENGMEEATTKKKRQTLQYLPVDACKEFSDPLFHLDS